MIKSRKLTWAGHVARMEEGRDGLGVDVRTILEWVLEKWVLMRGIGLIRLKIIGEAL